MFEVSRIAWRPFAIPMRRPHAAAHGTISAREGVVIRVEMDDGHIGIGEASPLTSYGGGTVAEVLEILPGEAQRLLPQERPRGRVLTETNVAAGSRNALSFAFDTALASIGAESEGLPLWHSLMAHRDTRLVGTRVRVPVNGLIGASDPGDAAREAAALHRAGFDSIKLKVTGDLNVDRERIWSVRSAVGRETSIRVDANGSWNEHDARAMLRNCTEAGIELVEQPLADGPGAINRMAELALDYPWVRIGIDESCRSLADIRAMGQTGAPLVAIIKPTISGLMAAHQMMRTAGASSLDSIVTTTLEAGVGVMACMQLAASVPGRTRACGLATLGLLEGDITTGPPTVEHGYIYLDSRPGLGVEIDERKLDQFATAPWSDMTA